MSAVPPDDLQAALKAAVHQLHAADEVWKLALEASGMTQKAFARREGVRYHTLMYWLRERRRVAKAGVAPSAPTLPPVRFHEVKLATPPNSAVEVQLPDGTIVRGGAVRELIALVRALRS